MTFSTHPSLSVPHKSLVDLLRGWTEQQPDHMAYLFLRDGEIEDGRLTYGELDRKARALAAHLQKLGMQGERALLLYQPGLDFIAAFFGCLYAGVTAVPVYPPKMNRKMIRLESIVTDATPSFSLTTSAIMERVEPLLEGSPELQKMIWIATDQIDETLAAEWTPPAVDLDTLAFIQYTSGSTGSPKGVMVSHGNLLHNEEMIAQAFDQSKDSLILGWLPLYHDMGLIGNVLQPLYLGTSCILMSPIDFLQHPYRWLKAISDYKATTSGGPNFAYELCARKITPEQIATLDLSSWTVAFNGAEPIHPATLDLFADTFAAAGFRKEAFYACYGLAEATLFVTGGLQTDLPVVKLADKEAMNLNRVVLSTTNDESVQPFVGSGKSWMEQRVLIVNPETGRICPEDEVGEIWVQGPSVAKGYWQNPELSEYTFNAHLTETGEGPFLRTGDLGFQLEGELYVTGRLKDLIIIRGRNHYPQDIESTVGACHSALNPGAGAAFSVDVNGEERLVVVQEVERAVWRRVNVEEVTAAVRQAVATHHELQAHAVVLIKPASIPKTSSGKIQRRACKEMFLNGTLQAIGDSKPSAADTVAAVEEPAVAVSRETWESTVQAERLPLLVRYLKGQVGRALRMPASRLENEQPLSTLGLDSLMAIELKHSIETDLGVRIAEVDFLQDANALQLAEQIQLQLQEEQTNVQLPVVTRQQAGGEYPLSYGQQTMWFLHQYQPESKAYHVPFAMRVTSELNATALQAAWEQMIARHAVLRTTYGERDGQPFQKVHAHWPAQLEVVDTSALSEQEVAQLLQARAYAPFALQDGPAYRLCLLSNSPADHILLLSFHHIAVDLWSISVLMDELWTLYAAQVSGQPRELAVPDLQYTDYVEWQEELLRHAEGEQLLAYWQQRLQGTLPVLELPADHQRPAVQSYRGASHSFELSTELTLALKKIAKEAGTTLYVVLLAAYQTFLHRYTGQDDILVGTPAAGRSSARFQQQVGYFVNPVVMRADFSEQPAFRDFLNGVRVSVLEALKHQDYPFPLLVEKIGAPRDASRNPVFQTMFVLQKPHKQNGSEDFVLGASGAQLQLGGVTLMPMALQQEAAQFDVTLSMVDGTDFLRGAWEFNTDLFEAATLTRMTGHFLQLLEGIAGDPNASIKELPMLSAEEKQTLLVDWNRTATPYPSAQTIPSLFAEIASKTPQKTAVTFAAQSLTYRELDERSNQLANRLRREGVGPNVLVGLCMKRSPEMIVGLLGILKAGGAYLPIDPAYPQDRKGYMLEDAQVTVLLAQAETAAGLPAHAATVILMDSDSADLAGESTVLTPAAITSDHPAYVIYTSGSTGLPKGVLVPHRGVMRLVRDNDFVSLTEAEVMMQAASISFDAATFEIWGCLLNGGRLVLYPGAHLSLEEFGRVLRDEQVTTTLLTAVVFHQLVDEQLDALRGLKQLLAGGEALSPEHVRTVLRELPHVRMINAYGPTESTVIATAPTLTEELIGKSVSLGRPIANTEAYVLDENLRPVPVGVPGELVLGGAGLAIGYLNRPELTAEKFVPHPFAEGGRVYRTGDLVRWLANGTLEFMGRLDHQVKIRGFRIELGEIEALLEQHPSVLQAVVTAQEYGVSKRLVAYFVPALGEAITQQELRGFLQDKLPEYMVPSVFVTLDSLPVTANGKIDRKALPAPSDELLSEEAYVAPRTETEARVAAIWAQVLQLESVGVNDSFFDIGGHSLLATQIISRLRQTFGIELEMSELFQYPTVAGLAARVELAAQTGVTAAALSIAPLARNAATSLPVSSAQRRLWLLDQLMPGHPVYNMPGAVRLQGRLNREALENSLNEIVRRHEVLRAAFADVNGELQQVASANSKLVLQVVDLRDVAEATREEAALQAAREEAIRPFDLAQGPLFRTTLVELGAEDHLLLITFHHIVSDGWSVGLFVREWTALYEAFVQGKTSPLTELSIQYADFAAWQEARLEQELLAKQLPYWKEQLAGDLPILQLPNDYPRPAVQRYAGSTHRFALSARLTEQLAALSRQEGATLYMTLLAAFNTLLHRYSGQDDLLVGTPVAGRSHAQVEELIGFFVNTLVVRTDAGGNPSFRDLLSRVKGSALGAFAHPDMPFDKLVEELQPERDMSYSPLFQVMFALQNADVPEISLPELTARRVDTDNGTAKYDLTLFMEEQADGVIAAFEYNTDLFAAATITRMAEHFVNLLETIVLAPETAIGELSFLGEADLQQLLVEWNSTESGYQLLTLPQHVEAQVAKTPTAVALIDGEHRLTYAELNERANQLAHYLQKRGVGAESLVGLCMNRSQELVIAILGILKSGGAYVPLDPNYPQERILFTLEDAQVTLLLTEENLTERLSAYEGTTVCLEQAQAEISLESVDNPETGAEPHHLAYVIYTSGSTGRPKGVAIEHRSASTLVQWASDVYSPDEYAGVLFSTSICFDLSIFEMFVPLSLGGKVILAENALHLPELAAREEVTLINTVPSAIAELHRLQAIPATAHVINLAGEPLKKSLVQSLYQLPTVEKVYNLYGPSEDTTYSTYALMDRNLTASPLIGRPLADTTAYVLNPQMQPVPVGAAGELFLGGAGLARGYLNRPDLTDEKFIADPFATVAGQRLYRTGDLVRYLPDGSLDYLGRIDHQVKVRGFRIELGEIEAVLAQHPSVREVTVIVREDQPNDPRVVAYVAATGDEQPTTAELRQTVKQKLPEYMVPSAFVLLDALPLTPNGKIDRKALPAPEHNRTGLASYIAPSTPLEEQLAALWMELLGVEQVGLEDNFFALGGHSLLATQVISRIRQHFGIEVPLRELFEASALADFAARVESLQLNSPQAAAIIPREHGSNLPLSYAQRRMWLLDQLMPGHPVYNMPGAVRLQGALNSEALEQSISAIVQRHAVLRSAFTLDQGDVQQTAASNALLTLKHIDLSSEPVEAREELALQLASEEAARPFDLAQGPLFRTTLVKLGAEEHLLLITFHHIVSDGWSIGLFVSELTALYTAFVQGDANPLPDLSIQYADYALWQQERLETELRGKQMPYWKEQLAGDLPLLQLPTDHPRPAVQRYTGKMFRFALPARLTQELHRLSQQEGATLYMTLLTAFKTLLHRYSGQDDLLVGTPVAGRAHAQIEDLIGFFVNTLVVRTDASGNPSFRDLLSRVKESALGAFAHQDMPFEMLVEELQPTRDMSYSPLFQAMFTLQNTPMPKMEMPGLTADLLDVDSGTSKFDLTLFMEEQSDALTAAFEYNSDLFETATITRMAEHFVNLLETIVATPETAIGELSFLGEADLQQLLVEWNNTESGYSLLTLPQHVEAQVAKTPTAVALIDGEHRLTYAELNERANQLAHYLQEHGVGAESLVGLCMNRSQELVISILGILKAGGAYVPLDPNYPQERILFTLEDARVTLLLTEENLLERLSAYEGTTVCLEQAQEEIAQQSVDNLATGAEPHHLAYVIYTSGSTGRPKGVAIEHGSASTLVQWANDVYSPDEYAGVLFSTSICFDLSIFEMFVPLSLGGKVLLAENALHLPELAAREEVTLINTVPSAIAELYRLQAIPATVSVINLAGEPLKKALVQSLYQVPTVEKVYNLYGPSEDTTYSTYALMDRNLTASPLIGRPLADTKAYVLNPQLQPVPIGAAGELFLGGAGLARGYLNRPDLTDEKFIANPFASEAGQRLYRTGDLVRYLPDGSLDYLGRIDHQVKVRGFRIELGEIEAVLAQQPNVREVTVIVREDQPNDPRIVAYVSATGDEQPTAESLRQAVKQKLPEYMVPSAFVLLDAMPLTPNGKIDRKALPAPDDFRTGQAAYVAPRTPLEAQLAALWTELLGVEQVGLQDNFFALGGHSLLATQLISRIRKHLGIEVPLRELFEASALADFAKRVESLQHNNSPQEAAIAAKEHGSNLPLSYAQRRMWLLDQLMPGHPVHNMPGAVRLQGALNSEALEQSIAAIVQRHAVLRTTFTLDQGDVKQTTAADTLVALKRIDLSGEPAEAREELARQLASKEAARPFDLAQGPLFRTTLVQLGAEDHLLLITFHHIVSDGWTIGLFVRELTALYTAFVQGDANPLPDLSIQYADYALRQQERLETELRGKQLPYWKEQLAGDLPLLQLPTDHPRPAVQSYAGKMFHFALPARLTQELHSLSQQEGATLYMTLLAAFKTLLHRYSGQDDLLVGTPVAGRNHEQTEDLIGFFVNTLVVRTDTGGNPSFRELLGRVKESALGAFAHQDMPFEMLVEELQPSRDMSYSPLFQAMFTLQNTPMPKLEMPGLTADLFKMDSGTSKFDLTLFMEEQSDALTAAFEYNTDLFETATITRMAEHFVNLLETIVLAPETAIGELPFLREADLQQLLVELNNTESGYQLLTLPQHVEAQVAKTPTAVALIDGERRMTYAELNERANQLAHFLQKRGVGAESLVGLCMNRSQELVIAILGILKAGGAYVPLDPNYPQERILFTLEDARVALLLTEENLLERLSVYEGTTVCLEQAQNEIAQQSVDNPATGAEPHHLAYVIYTSGSTGRPKGVAIEHRSVSTLVQWANGVYSPDEYAGVLFSTTICFDLSIFELFVPLSLGGKVILAENALHLPELAAREEVTLINTVPSAIAELVRLQAIPATARVINLCGEPLKKALVQNLYQVPTVEKVYNLYGPSEDTVYSTYALMDRSLTASPPIGRPIADTKAYVLNPQLQPVPIGAAGELFLGGAGLARGYLYRPDLTDEKFIANPFASEAGQRLYRTGDLVRCLPDGTLDYLGRIDHQVKVRGFRIELGEIEAVLAQQPSVHEVTVIVREDQPNDPRIVAYVTASGDEQPTAEILRHAVKQKLPEYMLPSAFVLLDALPLTPNGKIDRKALPAPDRSLASKKATVAPRTALEEQIAAIWSDVLNIETVGVYDSFFELGGHSLLATQVLSRLRQTLGFPIELRTLFTSPTIAALAEQIAEQIASHPAETNAADERISLLARNKTTFAAADGTLLQNVYVLPVSAAQRRMWLLDQIAPGTPAYNVPGAVRLQGQLNLAALEQSLAEIVRRHEVLRSTFVQANGNLQQIVHENTTCELTHLNLSGEPEARAKQAAAEEAKRPFDLAQGPLLRAMLVQIAEEDHLLAITFHHIVSDGWSLGLFVREFTTLYEAFAKGDASPLPELALQYADYAVMQQKHFEQVVLPQQLPYWKEQLAGEIPVLQLPTDRPRPSVQRNTGRVHQFTLPQRLTSQLHVLSRNEGATLFMTLLAAFKTLLHRYTGQSDLLVGTPIAGRGNAQIEELIGCFVNTLVVRTETEGSLTFRDLLARVKEATLGAYTHQDLPFEILVDELQLNRDLSRSPLFQVMFALQNAPMPKMQVDGLTVSRLDLDSGTAKFDLTLFMEERAEGLVAALEYNTDLFDLLTIERMATHFVTLLKALTEQPEQPIGLLPLLSEAERRQQLAVWNDTAVSYPQDQHFVHLFLEQVEQRPDAVAAIFEEQSLTYAELNARANQLAHLLQKRGVGPDVLVGICADRTLDLLVGLVGIWKAGGAYVPLDPTYPQERLSYMLEDSGVKLLLTQEHLLHALPEHQADVILLDRDASLFEQESTEEPTLSVEGDHLAYVIYTSGSTGRPKGTLIRHGGLSNYLQYARVAYRVDAGTGVPVHSSIAFDLTITGLFVPLTAGQRVILVPQDHGIDALLNTLCAHQDLSYIKLTPAHLRLLGQTLTHEQVANLTRGLVIGGEALTGEDVALWREAAPTTILYNEYGPTETVVGCSVYEIAAGDAPAGALLIGRPIANTQLYVLDAKLQPVPVGVYGELYIGGAGVARGYLNRDDLTAERFLADPFRAVPEARMYKTGDWVRYRADGNLEYSGRIDDQVKIRGYRIELGEIEAVIAEHPVVQEAVLIAAQDKTGEQRLISYAVVREGATLDAATLRGHLQAILPEYMVPSTFVFLDALPLTANGKVDRKALPQPDMADASTRAEYLAPRTQTEEALAAIWADLLGINRVGIHDDFFALGGHSLLGTQLMSRLQTTFGLQVPLKVLFEAPTVEQLAARLQQLQQDAQSGALSQLARTERTGDMPLSFSQERLWFFEQMEPGTSTYNMPAAVRVDGKLDRAALELSFREIVQRHETLRTRFTEADGQPKQHIAATADLTIPLLDLQNVPAASRDQALQDAMREEAQRPFDLTQGPLLRVTLVALAPEEHVLLLTLHHIVSDGWSTGVLLQELGALYPAFAAGKSSPLPELAIQYADFAQWERAWLQGDVLNSQLSYWKQQLAGELPVLQLPLDRPRPAVRTYRGATETFAIPSELLSRLEALTRREGATLYMTLLAAFKSLLSRYTGLEDVIVGSPIAGRTREETEKLIGVFINTLVLRTDLSGDPSFRELLSRVRQTALDAYAHQSLPFERLLEELQPARNLSISPLFQVMFILNNAPMEALQLPDVTLTPVEADTGTAKFDLTMTLAQAETGTGLRGLLNYNADLFDASTISRLAQHFLTLLAEVAADPEQNVLQVPLLSAAERDRMLYEWNDTSREYPEHLTLPQLFEEQAARTPDATALELSGELLTYRELNERANQVAHRLQTLGAAPDVPIGICMERSFDMIVGLLGILKSGAAYVPLDPTFPSSRLAYLLEDSQVPVLLTQEHLRGRLPITQAHVIALDSERESLDTASTVNPARELSSEHMAYIIYTSGSTGNPKGVMVLQRGICNILQWMRETYELTASDRVLQKANFSFDASVWEIFLPLMCGARLVLAKPGGQQDPEYLISLIQESGITMTHFIPPMLQMFLETDGVEKCASLRHVFCGGEVLPRDLQERFSKRLAAQLHNRYGPTEITINATAWTCEPGDARSSVPIGRPLANVQAYVLDRTLQPVPIGVPGELHIGGRGVARGYWKRDELTAEKFIANPFSGNEQARLYKTGDLVRWLPDGTLEFLGRIDEQVKLRGYRVELGEIQAVLEQHPAVREATLLVREDVPGDVYLTAYAVAHAEMQVAVEDLRGYLQTSLPEFMIPAAIVLLDAMPLTPVGKVDRRALPKPDKSKALSETYVAPRNEIEAQLAEIWSNLLGVSPVGVHDNFFELGGHSLLATRLITRIRNTFQVELPIRALFGATTVAQLAPLIEQAKQTPASEPEEPGITARSRSSYRMKKGK